VIPGILQACDVDTIVRAKRSLRLESLVDGLNRRVDQKTLEQTFGWNAQVREEPSSQAEVAAWLSERLRK
jgi:hypothetical protein